MTGEETKPTKKPTSPYHKFIQLISFQITRLFIKVPITPNQITISWITLQILASVILIGGTYKHFLVGVIIFQLAKLLDSVDGQVARIKNRKSLVGEYLDTLGHHVVNPMFFICLSIGVYKWSGNIHYLFVGLSGVICYWYNKLLSINPLRFEKKKVILDNFDYIMRKKNSLLYDLLKPQYPLNVLFFGILFNIPHIILAFYSLIFFLELTRKVFSIFKKLIQIDDSKKAKDQWNKKEKLIEWEGFYKNKNDKSLRAKIHNSRNRRILECFDKLKLKKKSKVLELGYGPGKISTEIYKRGHIIKGIDLSKHFQKIVTEKCKKINKKGKFEFLVGNLEKIKFPENSFDVIIGSAFFHYIKDQEKCLKNIYRMLKPNGFFIIGQRNMYSVSQFDNLLGITRTIFYFLSRVKYETSYKQFPAKKRLFSYHRFLKLANKTKFKDFELWSNGGEIIGDGYFCRSPLIEKTFHDKIIFANNLIFVLKKGENND